MNICTVKYGYSEHIYNELSLTAKWFSLPLTKANLLIMSWHSEVVFILFDFIPGCKLDDTMTIQGCNLTIQWITLITKKNSPSLALRCRRLLLYAVVVDCIYIFCVYLYIVHLYTVYLYSVYLHTLHLYTLFLCLFCRFKPSYQDFLLCLLMWHIYT